MRQPRATRHHPLLSPPAILGAIILLVGLGLVIFRSGGQAFSPGALSAVSATGKAAGGFANHADFAQDCLACHAPLSGVESNRCTTCHTEIASQRQAQQGLHGSVVEQSCTNCHQEHQGSDVNLLVQSLNQFTSETHAALFPLDGAHMTLTCTDCHVNNQFAGTPQTCAACHAEPDVHAGQFGMNCSHCHTTASWEEAQLRLHTFPLDHGMLGQLQCEVCHTIAYTEFTCKACHEPGFESRAVELITE
jgi:predicted CXXCH cytochrome family protein